VPASGSRTKTSLTPFPSFGTRLVASLEKTTSLPLGESTVSRLAPSPSPSDESRLARCVVWADA